MNAKVTFFTDCFSLIDILSMEDRGKIFTAGFLYTIHEEDADAEIDDLLKDSDRYTLAIWKQVKQKMKFNLDREKEISQKRKDAGRKGGQQKEANASKRKQMLANASKSKQDLANCITNTNTIHNNTKNKRKIINDEFGFPIYEDTRERVTEHD